MLKTDIGVPEANVQDVNVVPRILKVFCALFYHLSAIVKERVNQRDCDHQQVVIGRSWVNTRVTILPVPVVLGQFGCKLFLCHANSDLRRYYLEPVIDQVVGLSIYVDEADVAHHGEHVA